MPRVGRGLSRLIYGSPLYSLALRGRPPTDLRLAFTDPWPGDPELGARIVFGTFRLGGREFRGGAAAWADEALTEEALFALHGCCWLRDLRALGGDAARRQARTMIAAWIERFGRWHAATWRLDVLGCRLANWLSAYDFFIASAEDDFRERLFASLTAQVRHLARALPGGCRGLDLVLAVKGLLMGCMALPETPARLAAAMQHLEKLLSWQVLADGGHVQRNPSIQVEVLCHLIDLRNAMQAAHTADAGLPEPPQSLLGAVDRMAAALRFFRHGDGGLALFNGASEGDPTRINAVLAQAGAAGRPIKSARYCGFERIVAGRTVVLMDVGAPPPAGDDRATHAGPLAFELSAGRQRLIVNCGSPANLEDQAGGWAEALRGTAAHSTMMLDGANAIPLAEGGGTAVEGVTVTASRFEEDGSVLVDASHDGYRPRLGLVHRRQLYVSAAGDDIRGEDMVMGLGKTPSFAIRFHLHPSVKAAVIQAGSAALLRPPTGAGWRFRCTNGTLGLEESVYVANSQGRRRSQQLVISGARIQPGDVIKWALTRERRV
ncbi:MAG: heparinase II/III family protein [Rhodospirillaceae bacterium]|nr:heparinase II/III family protein [Rhodospirillaceae bacterium]